MSDKKPDWQIPNHDPDKKSEVKKASDVWSKGPNARPKDNYKVTFSEFDEARGRGKAQQTPKPRKAPNGKKRLFIFFALLILLYWILSSFFPTISIFDSPSAVRNMLFIIVFGGAIIYFSKASNRSIVKALFSWVLIIGVISGLYSVTSNKDPYSLASRADPGRIVMDEGEMHVKRASDGHFWVNTHINGTLLPMMVDTGATMVVLSKRDAESVGIDLGRLRYSGTSHTANGKVPFAMLRLKQLKIGQLQLENFVVTVNGGDMNGSLFGLSALNQFSSYEIRGDTMILRP